MSEPESYSYLRYLQAKETVDERARNRRVWMNFLRRLSRRPSPLRVLEVGAGEGATAERILTGLEDRSVDAVEYVLVDVAPDHLDAAQVRLREWASGRDYDIHDEERGVSLVGPMDVTLRFEPGDLMAFTDADEDNFDAVVAQAVLDLLPLSDALQQLRKRLTADGLWYLPIHFDGVTAFEPIVSPFLDARIEDLYHESMSGEGDVAGAQTGRRLLTRLPKGETTLLAAGSSDWVVFAREKRYPEDEAYFLHHIVHFIEEELSGHPALDDGSFGNWITERHRQIERGELIYVAHQLDVLAQEGGESKVP